MALDQVGQDPGPDFNAGARLTQRLSINAIALQGGQPPAVDLHEPVVLGAVACLVLGVHGLGPQTRFHRGDGAQQQRVDPKARTVMPEARLQLIRHRPDGAQHQHQGQQQGLTDHDQHLLPFSPKKPPEVTHPRGRLRQ